MIVIKKYFLLIGLCVAPLLCFGQVRISNVRFVQSGEQVFIHYHLDLTGDHTLEKVNAYMSLDGGFNYELLTKVSGDVGSIRTSGEKLIVFDIFEQFGNEEIGGNIQFKVEGVTEEMEMVKRTGERKFLGLSVDEPPPLIFVGASLSASDGQNRGILFGTCPQRWGGYVNLKLFNQNNKFDVVPTADFSSMDFTDKRYYRKAFTAGAIYRVFFLFYLYGGLGYGADLAAG